MASQQARSRPAQARLRQAALVAVGALACSGCHLLFSLQAVDDVHADGGNLGVCPAAYTRADTTVMRAYRAVETRASYVMATTDCRDDLDGRTRLAELTSDAMAAFVFEVLAIGGDRSYWVGASQQQAELEPNAGWTWNESGAAVASTLWAPGEPMDDDGIEDSMQDTAAIRGATGQLEDRSALNLIGYVCECVLD